MLGLYYEMTVGLTSSEEVPYTGDSSAIDPILLKRRSIILKPLIDSDNYLRKLVNKFVSLQKEQDSLITGAPITWARLSSGYRIVEFHVDRLQETVDLLREYYFKTDPTKVPNLYIDCNTIKLYQEFICNVVSTGNSFCAIEEGTGELIGVLLASIISGTGHLDNFGDENESSDLTATDLFNVLKLERALLLKANVPEQLKIDVYNCIHCICIKPDFCNNGIGTALVQACLNKLQKGDSPLCVGIFPIGACQTIALRLGFERLAEVPFLNVEEVRKNVYRSPSEHETVLKKSYIACMYIHVHLDSGEGEEEGGEIIESFDII